MKAKKLFALAVCLMTAFLLFAFSASAAEANHCEHGEEYYKWVTTPQTCNKEGKYERVCTECNQVVYTEVIPAHNYTVIYTGSVATCTEKGFEAVFCNWCNKVENRETPVDPKNHSFGEWTVTKEATCKDEGEKERKCSRCGETEKASVPVDSSKHNEGTNKWEAVTPVTCSQEGVEKNLCTVCKQEFTRTVPIHSDYKVNTEKYAVVESQEANCAQPDTTKYQCRDCGISFTVAGERDYDDHDFTDESLWYYTEGADCQHPGKVTKYCKNTRIHKIEEVYAPHAFEGAEVIIEEPKCNEDGSFTPGKKTVKCLYCDEVETVTVTDTHSFGEWSFTEEGRTCKTGGTATRTCTCGEVTETKELKAGTHLNYTYDPANIVYPDCLHDGYMYIYCDDCQVTARLFLEELDSKGTHTPGDWVVTEEATCEKSGVRELHCKMCDTVTEKETIKQLGHSCIILKEGTAADCENAGITDLLYCTLCKAVFNQEIIPASGHNFVEQNTPEEGAVRICDKCYKYEIVGGGQSVTCNCLCHNSNGIAKTVWKIITFFCKLFGMNQECKCGIAHY